jgi:hypothetical protein
MRVVGLDIHRSFAEAAMIDKGCVQQLGRIDLVRERVIAFAKRLGKNTEVVVEATCNTMAVVKLMTPHVKRMVIASHPSTPPTPETWCSSGANRGERDRDRDVSRTGILGTELRKDVAAIQTAASLYFGGRLFEDGELTRWDQNNPITCLISRVSV